MAEKQNQTVEETPDGAQPTSAEQLGVGGVAKGVGRKKHLAKKARSKNAVSGDPGVPTAEVKVDPTGTTVERVGEPETVEIVNAPPKESANGHLPAKRVITRGELFGYSITAVLRALGKVGWKFKETRDALNNLSLNGIADATIRAQLFAGRHGTRGEPAPLSKKNLSMIKSAAKAVA